jgi:hypothetical protein
MIELSGIIRFAWETVICVGDLAQDWSIATTLNLVSSAQARLKLESVVSLTPVSVANVAWQITGRCAAGVYDCQPAEGSEQRQLSPPILDCFPAFKDQLGNGAVQVSL